MAWRPSSPVWSFSSALPNQPLRLWLISGQLEPASPVMKAMTCSGSHMFFSLLQAFSTVGNRRVQSGVLHTMKRCEATIQSWESHGKPLTTQHHNCLLLRLLRYFRIFVWKLKSCQEKPQVCYVQLVIFDDWAKLVLWHAVTLSWIDTGHVSICFDMFRYKDIISPGMPWTSTFPGQNLNSTEATAERPGTTQRPCLVSRAIPCWRKPMCCGGESIYDVYVACR